MISLPRAAPVRWLLIAFTLVAVAAGAAPPAPKELSWDDLVPPGPQPTEAFPGAGIPGKGRSRPSMPPPFDDLPVYSPNPVKTLDGKYVKLPGYIVPLESDAGGLLNEFLLVPYFGACIHVPPPPPNQIVYVKLKKPFNLRSMADPYWVIGTISTKRWSGDVADTDYVMTGERLEVFQ
jgi:uncharacterized protein